MRSGNWRGVTLALGLTCALAFAVSAPCRADLFHHTIPDLVPAVDVNTGGPYYAPPIPYGHYTGKNLGGHLGKLGGLFHKGACGHCGGAGCDACGGGGGHGGLFHKGGCGLCGGKGCNACGGSYGMGDPCGGNGGGCGLGGLFHKGGACGSGCIGHASTIIPSAQGVPTAQTVVLPSAQCGDPGCGLFGKHRHKGCGLCSGRGCGSCASYDPCGSCGGKGCGLCGGGKGCGLCGGRGCAACAKLRGLLGHGLHGNKIKWFVGPGGPVPLTPGYTPYVITTRSPRDFLAFPPFVP